MIHEIRTETRPEAVYFFRIEFMPEVRVEFELPIEKVENIREKIYLIELHPFPIFHLLKSTRSERKLENNRRERIIRERKTDPIGAIFIF